MKVSMYPIHLEDSADLDRSKPVHPVTGLEGVDLVYQNLRHQCLWIMMIDQLDRLQTADLEDRQDLNGETLLKQTQIYLYIDISVLKLTIHDMNVCMYASVCID